MNDEHSIMTPGRMSRRGFLAGCTLATASLGLPTGIHVIPSRASKHIEIPEYDRDQCREVISHWTKNGWEPPLGVLLAVLIAEDWGLDGPAEKKVAVMKSFFSVTRMRRILEHVAAGGADARVPAALQRQLDKTGWYGYLTPFWLGLSAWLKVRIIDSFDPASLPCARLKLIIEQRPKIEDLARLPLCRLE